MKYHSFFHLIKRFLRKMAKDRIDVYSAQAAFYLIMAVMPMTMILLMFIKFTPLTEKMILDTLSEIFNEDLMMTVQSIVGNVYHGSITVLSITTLTMLWISGRAVVGLANGLNTIYRIKENRNTFFLRLRGCAYTLLMIFALMASLGVLVAGMRVREYIGRLLPLFRVNNVIMRFFLVLAALVLLTLFFNLLYVFLPNRARHFRTQLYGSVFTTVSWVIFTRIFLVYLSLASNLSIIYGGLLTISVMMFWMYFCMYFFFFGAEINAWKENPDSFPF